MPGVWFGRAANRLRVERSQLLRYLPDRRPLLADRSLSRLLRDDWPRTSRNLNEGEGAKDWKIEIVIGDSF